MTVAEIAAALGGHRAGRWWSCRCPAYDGRSPSLSLRDGDRRLPVRCWAGCDPRDVTAALRRRGLLSAAGSSARPEPAPPRGDDAARRMEVVRRIWSVMPDSHSSADGGRAVIWVAADAP